MLKLTARFTPEGKEPYTNTIYIDPTAISVIGENDNGHTWLPSVGVVVTEPPEKVLKMVMERGRAAQHGEMTAKLDRLLDTTDDDNGS